MSNPGFGLDRLAVVVNDDLISRESALSMAFSIPDKYGDEKQVVSVDWIKELPTVKPNHSKWIPVSERLPEEGEWVLVTVYSIHFGNDAPFRAIVRLKKGITEEERSNLKKKGDKRAKQYRFCDIFGNNLVPYAWETWGNSYYFGQQVNAWMPLPEPYKKEGDEKWQD